jgi:RNA polymerase sigma-70 factor, ECF subfamily
MIEEQEIFFTTLYKQYYAPVCGFIEKRVHNPELAQDLTQDAFLNVYRHRESVMHEKGIVSYLYTCALHNIATYYRNSDRLKDDSHVELAEDGRFAADPSETYTAIEPVRIALARLPQREKDILVQTFLYERSQREIAREHGHATRTVRNHLSTARKAFIQAYEQEERAS